jgi:trans-aconitate 2-methyltransferase
MTWNPELYNQFQAQRAAPFEDLIRTLTIREGLRVVDLGCGTGELTRRLADMLPNSHTLGIDNAPTMLDKAQAHARDQLTFSVQSIEDFLAAGQQYDVVFSHAALHWVDQHINTMPRLWKCVAAGGQVLVQMPSNHNHAVHVAAREIAAAEPFAQHLEGFVRLSPVLSAEDYAQLLFDAGFTDITVFEKIYPQVLADADAVVEFTRGTLLTAYQARLSAELYEAFVTAFRARVRELFPYRPAFYPFRRLLFSATKPANG